MIDSSLGRLRALLISEKVLRCWAMRNNRGATGYSSAGYVSIARLLLKTQSHDQPGEIIVEPVYLEASLVNVQSGKNVSLSERGFLLRPQQRVLTKQCRYVIGSVVSDSPTSRMSICGS